MGQRCQQFGTAGLQEQGAEALLHHGGQPLGCQQLLHRLPPPIPEGCGSGRVGRQLLQGTGRSLQIGFSPELAGAVIPSLRSIGVRR